MASVEVLDLAGLESRAPRLDNFGRVESADTRVERRLAMPVLGVRAVGRIAGRLGPASDSSVSGSVRTVRRGKARLPIGTSGPGDLEVTAGCPGTAGGKRRYLARLQKLVNKSSTTYFKTYAISFRCRFTLCAWCHFSNARAEKIKNKGHQLEISLTQNCFSVHFTRILCLQSLRHGRPPFFPNFVLQSKGAEPNGGQRLQGDKGEENEIIVQCTPSFLQAIFRKHGREDSFGSVLLPGLPNTASPTETL